MQKVITYTLFASLCFLNLVFSNYETFCADNEKTDDFYESGQCQRKYYVCHQFITYVQYCDEGLVFDDGMKQCIYAYNDPSNLCTPEDDDYLCEGKIDGKYARGDCSIYFYTCEYGRLMTTRTKCNGFFEVFDENYQRCVNVDHTRCAIQKDWYKKEDSLVQKRSVDVSSDRCAEVCRQGSGYCSLHYCHCTQGFTGPFCQETVVDQSFDLTLLSPSVCDLSRSLCHHIVLGSDSLAAFSNNLASIRCAAWTSLRNQTFLEIPAKYGDKQIVCPINETLLKLPNVNTSKSLDYTSSLELALVQISPETGFIDSWLSEKKLVVITNSACLKCTKSNVCQLKESTCLIQGQCFHKGDESQEGVCDPDYNPFQWKQVEHDNVLYHWVAMAITLMIALLICAGVLVCLRKWEKSQKHFREIHDYHMCPDCELKARANLRDLDIVSL